jgi:hypothetical protein
MSSKAAIGFQFEAVLQKMDPRFAMDSCSLASENDRVEYLRYFLTKALYEDATTVIGSVVLCSENEAIGVKQLFESCIEAAPSRIHTEHDKDYKGGLSFMGRIRNFFEKKMETFVKLIRAGTIIFIPRLEIVSIDNRKVINEIRNARPLIISWSNVIDYLEPKLFHKVAREMSGPDTVHYLHSCNWTTRVYGTDIFDVNEKTRLYLYSGGLVAIENGHSMYRGLTKQGCYHFRDICTIILGRKFASIFFRYFFGGQEVTCGCFTGQTPLKPPFPFWRSVRVAFMVFAYKETGITFGMDTYNYLDE